MCCNLPGSANFFDKILMGHSAQNTGSPFLAYLNKPFYKYTGVRETDISTINFDVPHQYTGQCLKMTHMHREPIRPRYWGHR